MIMTKLTNLFAICLSLAALTGSSIARAATPASYSCRSAETSSDLVFTVMVTVTGQPDHGPSSADIVATFPKAIPPATRYDHVPYTAGDSGTDHLAFEAAGIAVVVYPDPKMLSTVVFGDAGGTQVGLVMRCSSVSGLVSSH